MYGRRYYRWWSETELNEIGGQTMKWIGVMMICVGCTLYGWLLDERQRKRIKELEQFIYTFELLRAEIDYRLTPLKEAAYQVSSYVSSNMRAVLNTFAQTLDSRTSIDVESMWRQTLQATVDLFHLKGDDYEALYGFGTACGYLDKEMQKRNIEIIVHKLKEEVAQSKEAYYRTTKLNKYLGFLVGACISIFLI